MSSPRTSLQSFETMYFIAIFLYLQLLTEESPFIYMSSPRTSYLAVSFFWSGLGGYLVCASQFFICSALGLYVVLHPSTVYIHCIIGLLKTFQSVHVLGPDEVSVTVATGRCMYVCTFNTSSWSTILYTKQNPLLLCFR